MFFKVRPIVPALAFVLAQAAGATVAPRPALSAEATLRQQALDAGVALTFLNAQSLGLGLNDSFQEDNLFTNAQGQTVARFSQTYLGYRVFGTSVVVRVGAAGAADLAATAVLPGITLDNAVKLTPANAIQVAHQNIDPEGAYAGQPTAERIVFPTRLAQGFKLAMDAQGHPVLDRTGSLVGPRPTQALVWAYQVNANLKNPQDGNHELHLIVDAGTGQILRKWDQGDGLLPQPAKAPRPLDYLAMKRIAASRPTVEAAPSALRAPKAAALVASTAATVAAPATLTSLAPAAAPVAAQGWGNHQYQGMVSLDTIQSPLGTGYDLVDVTRTTNPHPIYQTNGNQTWYWDPMMYIGLAPATGDFVYPYAGYEYFNTFTMDNTTWKGDGVTGGGSTTNVWGDGLNYNDPFLLINGSPSHIPKALSEFHLGDLNAETAAVGAHYAMATTYDMYSNVLGRLAIDGKNSAMIQVVHDNLGAFDNAHWSDSDLMMHYGDGDWSTQFGGNFYTFTQITIAGHEMSHGEMLYTANVDYFGEGMGLNEANSDIMGMCVEAYSKRGPTDPANRIPDGKADWILAPEISPTHTPLRWLYKPSIDGMSPDAWASGIYNLDGHYTMGVASRFFYFLSMGASADPKADTYSPYLPQGMTGIGIDAAAHVWYKAVSEYMSHTTLLFTIRGPLLQAAADLYGASSPQGQAVANALSAVNLGAAYGSNGRPLVTFPNDLTDPNSPLGALVGLETEAWNYGIQPIYSYTPIVPMGETVKLNATVGNASDTSVAWTTGWPFLYVPFPNDGIEDNAVPVGPSAANGSFDADGTYHAPLVGPKFAMVKATSKADPLEFGYCPVMVANLDSDGDGESDAVDMGAFALCYGLPLPVTESVNTGGFVFGTLYSTTSGYVGYTFDDYSLQVFNEAFMNAFVQ